MAARLSAERAERLLVEQRDRRPGKALVDHQPDRVRADVDDRERPAAAAALGGAALSAGVAHAGWISPMAQLQAVTPFFLRALPRPDRLGLVMK